MISRRFYHESFSMPSSQVASKATCNYRQNKPVVIMPKFLPQGWRFLRPDEEVERTDFFWSKQNKTYLPAYRKFSWRGRAGNVIPFIRRMVCKSKS